jgi:hypothetical protein
VSFDAMHILSLVARSGGLVLFGGVFGLIVWKMLVGSIGLDQLLEGDIGGSCDAERGVGTYVSAGRAQALATTMFVALYYLLLVVRDPANFPRLPTSLMNVYLGSQCIYVGGKAHAMLVPRIKELLRRRVL